MSCFLMLPAVLHAEGGARRGGEDAESSFLLVQQPHEPPVRGLRIGGWRRYTTCAGFGGVGEHPARAVTAGIGFGVRKIESFMEERVEVVERRVIEVRHGFALHGGRYLGYSHEVELRATGEQGSVLVTRAALEVAASTAVSIVASVGYEVDAPKSARAARTFVSSLGVLLTPVRTVSISIMPGLRAPEVGTVTPVITLAAMMRY